MTCVPLTGRMSLGSHSIVPALSCQLGCMSSSYRMNHRYDSITDVRSLAVEDATSSPDHSITRL